ncbi:MAG: hypothetical protein ACLSTN_10620 [Coprococcus sp.]
MEILALIIVCPYDRWGWANVQSLRSNVARAPMNTDQKQNPRRPALLIRMIIIQGFKNT